MFVTGVINVSEESESATDESVVGKVFVSFIKYLLILRVPHQAYIIGIYFLVSSPVNQLRLQIVSILGVSLASEHKRLLLIRSFHFVLLIFVDVGVVVLGFIFLNICILD